MRSEERICEEYKKEIKELKQDTEQYKVIREKYEREDKIKNVISCAIIIGILSLLMIFKEAGNSFLKVLSFLVSAEGYFWYVLFFISLFLGIVSIILNIFGVETSHFSGGKRSGISWMDRP